MYYVKTSQKAFAEAVTALDAAVKAHQFGVLHVHDIGNTLRSKGQIFAEECKVFEVCSPRHATAVLAEDLRLNMALPCRISVYTGNGQTRIGMIAPSDILAALSDSPVLAVIADEVDSVLRKIIDEAI